MGLDGLISQGFSIIPDVVSAPDVARFVDEFYAAPVPRSRAGARHILKHPAVDRLARQPEVLGIAQNLLGNNAYPFRATLFDKSRDSNWLVVWHQDTALPLRERLDVAGWGPWSLKDGVTYAHAPTSALEEVVALRLHLDDSTEENGPLRVLPGTHKHGVLTDDSVRQFLAEIAPVDCLVPRGGILAMRPLLVHASSKSRGQNPRRVLHIEYASSQIIDGNLRLAIA